MWKRHSLRCWWCSLLLVQFSFLVVHVAPELFLGSGVLSVSRVLCNLSAGPRDSSLIDIQCNRSWPSIWNQKPPKCSQPRRMGDAMSSTPKSQHVGKGKPTPPHWTLRPRDHIMFISLHSRLPLSNGRSLGQLQGPSCILDTVCPVTVFSSGIGDSMSGWSSQQEIRWFVHLSLAGKQKCKPQRSSKLCLGNLQRNG